MTDQPTQSATPTASQRWTQRILIFVSVIAAFGAISRFISKDDLPECDSRATKDSLSDIFKAKKIDALSYNSITTVSSAKEEKRCTASLTLKDEILEIDYRLYFEGGKDKKVEITAARDKPKP